MKPDALDKLSLPELKKRCTQTAHEIRDAMQGMEKTLMVAGDLIYQVQTRMAWDKWGFPNFTAWSEWFQRESGMSHGKFYSVLGTRQALGQYNGRVLERLGSTKAYQLSRLAKKKPKMLQKAVELVLSTPGITTHEVEQKVDSLIAGEGISGQRLKLFKVLVLAEDLECIIHTFKVMQFLDPIENVDPDSDFARGIHLKSLCDEMRSNENFIKAEKEFSLAEEAFEVQS